MNELLNQTQRINEGPTTQGSYEKVLDELANLRMKKVLAYGQDRYLDPDQKHMMFITYSDIYRKFIRIKNFIQERGMSELTAEDGESLRDCFMDLANYSLMGAQCLDGNVEVPYSPPQSLCIDQIAIASDDPGKAMAILTELLGVQDTSWVSDEVKAEGVVRNEPGENTADLNFNYRLMKGGLEFEVLHYKEGKNWLQDVSEPLHGGVASHLGIHCTMEQMEDLEKVLRSYGYKMAQQVRTQFHTNPHIANSRRYCYVIYDTRKDLGLDIKLIVRLPYEAPE